MSTSTASPALPNAEEKSYVPREYWERRLRRDPSLRAVGHRVFSLAYNEWLYKRKQQCLERALTGIDVRDRQVLDVGCGTGFFVDWYRNRGAAVTGVDLTQVSVARLRERIKDGTFRVADVSDAAFPLAGRIFDIVNVVDVLYHIVDDERFVRALRNLGGCCADGGLVLATDQFAAPCDTMPAAHVKMRSLAAYQAVLPGMGLHLQALLPLYAWLNDASDPDQESKAADYFEREDSEPRISHDNLSLAVWRHA